MVPRWRKGHSITQGRDLKEGTKSFGCLTLEETSLQRGGRIFRTKVKERQAAGRLAQDSAETQIKSSRARTIRPLSTKPKRYQQPLALARSRTVQRAKSHPCTSRPSWIAKACRSFPLRNSKTTRLARLSMFQRGEQPRNCSSRTPLSSSPCSTNKSLNNVSRSDFQAPMATTGTNRRRFSSKPRQARG